MITRWQQPVEIFYISLFLSSGSDFCSYNTEKQLGGITSLQTLSLCLTMSSPA